MRVGIIGLGSIAKKAYLPVVTVMPSVTPVLVSRNPRTLTEAAVGAHAAAPDLVALAVVVEEMEIR
jgi:virulence factor